MRLAQALVLSALAVGCVGKRKYNDLLAEYDDTRTSLERENADLADENDRLRDNLSTAKRRIEDMASEQARLLADQESLQSNVSEMQKALVDLSQRKAEADARISEFRSLLARFKSLIDAGKLRVKIVDGRMVVELATDILFGSGSATLSADGRASLAEVAVVLASIPDRKFQVEGHTDDVPIRTAQYKSNWDLAAARALTVTQTLIDGGLPSERVSAASYAETRPVQPNDTPAGRASNRRIEIVVVPDLSTMPGFEELSKIGR